MISKLLKRFNKPKTRMVSYHPDKTILSCNQCGYKHSEWYNDQPGDPCISEGTTCGGKMIRILKSY